MHESGSGPELVGLLRQVAAGEVSPEEGAAQAASMLTRSVGDFARLDAHRTARTGLPEAVFAEGKNAEQVAAIAAELDRLGQPVVVTRLDPSKADAVRAAVPAGRYHAAARIFTRPRGPDRHPLRGPVAVICAGTSDLPVAEEAALTLEAIGQPVERLCDVGVAGIHRLLARVDVLRRAGVCVVAAGMEGALPSVVGGLVSVPVIAVPTPVGYGASFNGLAALLGMLNTCSPGVAAVNIGNGFGAACVAALANRVGPAREDAAAESR